MRTVSTWPALRAGLSARGGALQPRPAAAFWDEFNGRLSLHPQAAPARRPAAWSWVFGGAGAAAAAAGAAVWLGLPTAAPAAPGGVLSYEVQAPHGAVMILRDADTRATILWVSGVPETAGRGS